MWVSAWASPCFVRYHPAFCQRPAKTWCNTMLSVFPFRAVWELACFVGTADQLQHISLKMLFGEATLARCHIDGLCEILVVSAVNEATWSGAVQTIALQKPQELLDLFSSGNCSASAFAINSFLSLL